MSPLRISIYISIGILLLIGAYIQVYTSRIPALPQKSTDPSACLWQWVETDTFGAWTERCKFETGTWFIVPDTATHALNEVITSPGQSEPEFYAIVVQEFTREPNAELASILPTLSALSATPTDGSCVFTEYERVAQKTRYLLSPVGTLKEQYDAQNQIEVPEPPCGPYGIGPAGKRYFETQDDSPRTVYFVNLGQDGTLIDPDTITPH